MEGPDLRRSSGRVGTIPAPQGDTVMKLFSLVSLAAVALMAIGCSTAPKSEGGKVDLDNDVAKAMAEFRKHDSNIDAFLDKAAGYAVFPTVGKGAVGVGGAYGKGELYEKGHK